MTVFKTFLKVLNKNKFVVILYTVILLCFGGFNMSTSDNSTNFMAKKPDVLIVNNDENIGITENLIEYIKNNTNIKEIENNEEKMNEALFYRDVSYIIYIPQKYRENVLKGENPEIQIKSAGDAGASYAEMILSKYVKIENIYAKEIKDEEKLIKKINDTLAEEAEIEMTSKLDTDNIAKATFYYNFANYSMLAGAIYVICLILSSFHDEKIRKRTLVSSMSDKKHNRILLIGNGLFVLVLWAFYVLISFVLVGGIMFSVHGIIYMINSFIFMLCALAIAFLISNLVNNKNAINGIVNVVALGSSFLCGAFVPAEWLPDIVLKIAHILPSYWYIQTNELMKTIEIFNRETLKPVLLNMGVLLGFVILLIILTNVIVKKKRRIG